MASGPMKNKKAVVRRAFLGTCGQLCIRLDSADAACCAPSLSLFCVVFLCLVQCMHAMWLNLQLHDCIRLQV